MIDGKIKLEIIGFTDIQQKRIVFSGGIFWGVMLCIAVDIVIDWIAPLILGLLK